MKFIGISILTVTIMLLTVFLGCSKTNTLNKQLDELERIIVKYEPQFDTIEYASKEYGDMIVKYNEEIFKWAEVFEKERYKRDEKGKIQFDKANNPVSSDEFNKEVETRFYELNNRMTRMVLAKIPKMDSPVPVAEENKESGREGQ